MSQVAPAPHLDATGAPASVAPWGQTSGDDPFHPEVFRNRTGDLTIRWHVPEGHALYQARLKVATGPGWHVSPTWPEAPLDSHGTAAYTHPFEVTMPVQVTDPSQPFQVRLTYQGCQIDVLCYPPRTAQFALPATVHVPTLVVLETANCPPCKHLDATLSTPAVQRALKGWTILRLNGQDDPNLAARYGMDGYPGLRQYRPDIPSTPTATRGGDLSPDALVHWLHQAP